MWKYSVVVIGTIYLFACGQQSVEGSPMTGSIDPELHPLVSEFVTVTEGRGRYPEKWSVQFGTDLPEGALGYCYFPKGTNNFQIVIDIKSWGRYGEASKTTIMFHELSHCILRTIHTPDTTNYMYSHLIDISKANLVMQVRANAGLF